MMDVFPGAKTYISLLTLIAMFVCQNMGYHVFSKEEWGVVTTSTAVFWKMGLDRKPEKKK